MSVLINFNFYSFFSFRNLASPFQFRVFGCFTIWLALSACSNWELKEKCEKTNWFSYAQGVSFSGKYLEEDSFVKQCRSVEKVNSVDLDRGFKFGREKGCTYDEILSRGRQGQVVNFQFCDGLDAYTMKQKHREGLKIYCLRDNGYPVGKSGQVYQNVCLTEEEKSFLPNYQRGRRDFLSDSIKLSQREIGAMRQSLESYEQELNRISREFTTLPHLQQCETKSVYDQNSHKEEMKQICQEPSHISNMRSNLDAQLSRTRTQKNELNSRLEERERSQHQMEDELIRLPNIGQKQ